MEFIYLLTFSLYIVSVNVEVNKVYLMENYFIFFNNLKIGLDIYWIQVISYIMAYIDLMIPSTISLKHSISHLIINNN